MKFGFELRDFGNSDCYIRNDVWHHDSAFKQPIDIIVADDVIRNDCYRFRQLCTSGFVVNVGIDIGANIGTASRFISKLWPTCNLIAVEPAKSLLPLIELNAPNAKVITGFVGELADSLAGLRNKSKRIAADLLLFCDVDLLKIDCEGGEVGFFEEAATSGRLCNIKSVVGEWHGLGVQHTLKVLFEPTHNFTYLDRGWGHDLFWATRRA